MVEAFARQKLADALPPLQASLVERLPGSFVSAFEVVARDGNRTVLQDVAGRRRYEVAEHNDDIVYGPGSVAVGRLIPGEGSAWRRSPGMAFLEADGSDLGQAFRESLRMSDREDVPRAISVEATLLLLTTDETPPRKVRPALTRKLAKDLAFRTIDLLEKAGLADPASAEDVAEEMERAGKRRSSTGEVRAMRLAIDDVTAEWVAALHAQGRGMP